MARTLFLNRLALAAVAGIMAACAQAATIASMDMARPEGTRHYLLATPESASAGKRPLVILLHGHGGNAEQLLGRQRTAAPMSVWLQLVDRDDLIVAAPDGSRGTDGKQGWNDCREAARSNPKTDDVGYIDAIVAREVLEHEADPQRVFVMGMSNGGMMAFRYAIEAGARLAGFAAVSASMAEASVCAAPRQPVSMLVVSGTADPLVPYGGGDVGVRARGSRGGVIGVETAADIWRRLAGLSATAPVVTPVDHRDTNDPTRAVRTVWGTDPRGVQVELLRIDGGGHVEPSIGQRIRRPYARLVGAQNGDVEVAEEGWRFFRDKRRPTPR